MEIYWAVENEKLVRNDVITVRLTWRRKLLIYAMQHCGCWTNDFLIRLLEHWISTQVVLRSNATRIERVCVYMCCVYSQLRVRYSFIHNQGEARQLLSDKRDASTSLSDKKHAARSDKARRRTEHTICGTESSCSARTMYCTLRSMSLLSDYEHSSKSNIRYLYCLSLCLCTIFTSQKW